MNKIKGKIIKGIAGFYYVFSDKKIYECKAKGIFRNNKQKPLVGDNVFIEVLDEEKSLGNIIEILERKNTIIRPALCNIDYIILILSVDKPKPIYNLIDKYIINLRKQNINIAIIWNKIDLDFSSEYIDLYKNIVDASFEVSAYKNIGFDKVRDFIKGKTVAFVGPSGVGKSSITNIIFPKANMQIGEISKKIDRGKHTTRHSQLFIINENTYICDTPGFSCISIDNIKENELKSYYLEFLEYEPYCKFNACLHFHEPECAVKKAVGDLNISKIRYESYIKNLEEIKKVKKY